MAFPQSLLASPLTRQAFAVAVLLAWKALLQMLAGLPNLCSNVTFTARPVLTTLFTILPSTPASPYFIIPQHLSTSNLHILYLLIMFTFIVCLSPHFTPGM